MAYVLSKESVAAMTAADIPTSEPRARLVNWPVAAICVIALNVTVFLAMGLAGAGWMEPGTDSLLRWGADYSPKTTHGEYWRIVTSGFVHIGALHLVMNMVALWLVARSIETRLGRAGFVIVYLLSGVAGSLLSLVAQPDVVSAGASGSVMGMYAALLGFTLRNHRLLEGETSKGLQRQLINILAYNLVYGLQRKGIDNAAHLGGAASGFLMGLILSYPVNSPDGIRQTALNKAFGLLGFVAALGAVYSIPPTRDLLGELNAIDAKMQAASELHDKHLGGDGQTLAQTLENEKIIAQKVLPAMRSAIEQMDVIPLPAREMESGRQETTASWRSALHNSTFTDAALLWSIAIEQYQVAVKELQSGKLPQAEFDRRTDSEVIERVRKVESLTDGLIVEADPAMTANASHLHAAATQWRMSLQLVQEAGKAKSGKEADRLLKLANDHKRKSDAEDSMLTK